MQVGMATMKLKKQFITLLSVSALPFAFISCEVEQTEEGSMPSVDVEGGNLPEYDVDAKVPDVDLDTKTVEVEVPTVDVDMKDMPDVDVEAPEVEVNETEDGDSTAE